VLLFVCNSEELISASKNRSSYHDCEDNKYLDASLLMRSTDENELEEVASRFESVPELGAFMFYFLLKVHQNLTKIETKGPNV
jgi:hypothetical protein